MFSVDWWVSDLSENRDLLLLGRWLAFDWCAVVETVICLRIVSCFRLVFVCQVVACLADGEELLPGSIPPCISWSWP